LFFVKLLLIEIWASEASDGIVGIIISTSGHETRT